MAISLPTLRSPCGAMIPNSDLSRLSPARSCSNAPSRTSLRVAHEAKRVRTDGRCHLKGRQGDATKVILPAVGHDLRLVLAWLGALCRLLVLVLLQAFATQSALRSAS